MHLVDNLLVIEFMAENQDVGHYPAFMKKTPSPFSYQCLEPTIMINIPIGHMNKAYQYIPKWNYYGRLAMENAFTAQKKRIVSLLSQTAEQRYLLFIEQYPHLFQRVPVTHLCSYLGVERQTLTRIRKKLSQTK